MINNEIHRKLFYFLSTSEDYLSSNILANRLGLSVRTIKAQVKQMQPLLKDMGCELSSKPRYGYKLIIDDEEMYLSYKEEIENYVKYSHSYKDSMSEILSYFVNHFLFADKRIDVEAFSEELYITPTAFRRHFNNFIEQLKSFDIELHKDTDGKYSIIAREKDLRLLAKDYLVIRMTDILNYEYDFHELSWSNERIDFYEIYDIVEDVLSRHPITMFEVGRFRISCYLYISFLRTLYPIDIKTNNIRRFISEAELRIADDILLEIRKKYLFIDFQYEEVISLALNIMCERDFTSYDVENHTLSDELLLYTRNTYELITSYEQFSLLRLFPKEETILWLTSISARVIASNHKQNKPYFFYNDKSVYYSSFSFFIARLYASFIREYGDGNEDKNKETVKGPTLNIYCISYLTNMIYTNLMLLKPECRKLNLGIYSFLGRLTSQALIKAIKDSTLSNYIESIQVTEPNKKENEDLDLLFYHQKIEHLAKNEASNQYGFSSSNFIDADTIYTIKSKYLQTSDYKNYFEILDHIKITDGKDLLSFDSLIDQYPVFPEIKRHYQIVNHEGNLTAFMFVKQDDVPIFDIYLLKDRFSYKGHRYKTLYVLSVNLISKDLMYYKTMEALSQILSRNALSISVKTDTLQLKKDISHLVEKYLTETLI